jgi:hypothetical protein
MKKFETEFEIILDRLKNKKPFAFSRWADGELFVLRGESFSLSPTSHFYHFPEDQKHFDATQHDFVMQKLWEAFRYKSENYHIGICSNGLCPPGTFGLDSVRDWMIENSGSSVENITFANVLINSNYHRYRKEMIPVYGEYDIVIMCNERCDLSGGIFDSVVKDFRVGSNCIVNDIDKIDEMIQWTKENKPEGHLFLFAASSLGNMCIHKLHEVAPNNTYIDVGSSLNPDMNLSIDRGYLHGWAGLPWRGHDMSQELIGEETW